MLNEIIGWYRRLEIKGAKQTNERRNEPVYIGAKKKSIRMHETWCIEWVHTRKAAAQRKRIREKMISKPIKN